jgi:hypothetical protein
LGARPFPLQGSSGNTGSASSWSPIPWAKAVGRADLRVCILLVVRARLMVGPVGHSGIPPAGFVGCDLLVVRAFPLQGSSGATCWSLDHSPCRVRRGIPVALRPGLRFHGPKPVVWARGSPRLHRLRRVLRTLRPGLRFHGPKPVVWSHGFQGSGFSNDLRAPSLDKCGDGSKTSAQRLRHRSAASFGLATVRRAEERATTRRDHGAGGRARRIRPIAILVEGLHPPNNSKIRSPEIRESRRVLTWPPSRRSKPHRTRPNGFCGTRRSAGPGDGFWPVESETRTNRYRYSPTNPPGRMVERPTGSESTKDQQVPPDEPCRGNGRTTNMSHPTNPAGGMVERPTGRTRRTPTP